MMTLPKLVNAMSWFMGEGETATPAKSDGTNTTWYTKVVKPVIDLVDVVLVPLIIVLGSAGIIYSIILGVNYAKAESTDKREEAKKRIINFIIGFVITIVLLILLKLFTTNAPAIFKSVDGYVDNSIVS